jgi:glutathione S-transferase
MSTALTLVIGNKNYSSWSLRPWLVMRHFDVAFDEVRLTLDTPEFHARIAEYSPAGRVPVLVDGALSVWDSLAICETVNERYLDGRGWPADSNARAAARTISAEMHSGFTAMRRELPMNCVKRAHGFMPGADASQDIARVRQLWRETREKYGAGGPFLFGDFSIADAMYAPVVLRFITYDVAVDGIERDYVGTILEIPALREWLHDAAQETDKSELHERMTP